MIILSIPFQKGLAVPEHYKGWREYRLDYNPNPDSFEEKLINEQTIITIRDPQEGGINPFPLQKKIELYINYIKQANCLVDLELENHEVGEQIPSQNLILSWHCFTDEWTSEILKQKIEKAISLKPRFLKIALNISHYSQFNQISEILRSYDYPIIFVGMGLLGKQSRILFNQLNSKATYIGLESNSTASGQLNLAEAELYNLFSQNSDTKIGGLIGSEQVYHSLGLKFYNQHFKQNNLNAVYLPLPVSDLADFLKWQKTVENKTFGFSITMPFKTEIANLVEADERNINLYLPSENSSYNSDKIALQKSLDYLQVGTDDKILVYGSGATAEMVLQVLDSHSNVFLKSRNSDKVKKLTAIYNLPEAGEDKQFDLIINCTPIGMKGEDFLKETGLKPIHSFIDLPYSRQKTTIIELCLKNKIEFVDGQMFWQWQSEKQLAEFIKVLAQ